MDKFLTGLKAHSPAILAFALAFYTQYSAAIAAWITAHPKYASWGTVITFVAGYYLKSPFSPKLPAVPETAAKP